MSLVKSPTLTAAKLAANRSNAAKSSGPRSARGKERTRLNALKTGVRSPTFRNLAWAIGGTLYSAEEMTRGLLKPGEANHPLFVNLIESISGFPEFAPRVLPPSQKERVCGDAVLRAGRVKKIRLRGEIKS